MYGECKADEKKKKKNTNGVTHGRKKGAGVGFN